jgi:hypothetical protein
VAAEQADRAVELVADETTFEQMAWLIGQSPADVLSALKSAGVQGLGVPEDTLSSLDDLGLVTVVSGAQWLDALRSSGLPPPGTLQPQGTYALVKSGPLADFVRTGLAAVTGLPVQVLTLPDGRVALGVASSPAAVGDLPLGFRPASPGDGGAFALARSLGMDVVPRPLGTEGGMTAAVLSQTFDQIASAGVPVHTILFAGASTLPIPGYPDHTGTVAGILRQNGWSLGVIETAKQLSNVDQPGTRQLNDAIGQATVRVYSVPPWMLQQYTEPQTVDAIVTSVQERNLRILYLHPYQTGSNLEGRTVQLYTDVANLLRQRGYTLGPPRPFPAVKVPAYQRMLQALAVVAAGLWLLELLFPGLRSYGYAPLAVLGALAILLAAASRSKSQLLVPMAAASVFGGLAMCYVAALWDRLRPAAPRDRTGGRAAGPTFLSVWGRSALSAVAMAGISFAGALVVATFLGDTTHFLEWEYFRGIKVTYLGIPVLAACAFASLVGFGAPRQRTDPGLSGEIAWLGDQPVKYKHVAMFLVVAVVAAIYLLRSGNVSAAYVPGIEQHLRDFLERHIRYRPREKEFLVGYPALFIAVLCARRGWRWGFLLFLLGAATGQVSVVDTFEHIRTPFLTSLQRETLGLISGLVTGTIALAVAWVVVRVYDRRVGGARQAGVRGAAGSPIVAGAESPEADHRTGAPAGSANAGPAPAPRSQEGERPWPAS